MADLSSMTTEELQALRKKKQGGGKDLTSLITGMSTEELKALRNRTAARERIAQERMASPMFSGIDDAVRATARGIPLVGGAMDEVSAGLNTGFGYLSDYDQELAYQRERDALYDEEHPIGSTALQVGGAVLGTLAAARQGMMPSMPASMMGKVAQGARFGAGVGAVEGFTRGEGGLGNRVGEAAESAVFGSGLGIAAPAVARGLSAAWNGVASMLANRGVDAKVANQILSELQAAGMSPQQAQTRLQELGPEAMLADVHPGMQQMAGATGISDSGAARTITERLARRREMGRTRVAQSLDNAFGPPRDPYAVQEATRALKTKQGDLYEKPLSRAPRLPRQMGDLLAQDLTIPAQGMTLQNRQLMGHLMTQIDDALAADTPELTARRLHDFRKSMDAQIVYDRRSYEQLSSQDKAQQAVLRQARGAVDDILKNRIPGFREADEGFAPITRQQQAYDEGRTQVLKGGPNTMTPEQLSALQAGSSDIENTMRQQGVRTELDRIMSNQRRDPAVAVDAVTTRDWNDRKLRNMVGPWKAAPLVRDLDREATFTQTSNLAEAGRGSRTAPLAATAQRLYGGGRGGAVSDVVTAGGTGTMLGGPMAGGAAAAATGINAFFRSMSSKLSSAAPERIRKVADRLTLTGDGRDAFMRDLANLVATLPKQHQTARAVSDAVRWLLISQSGRLGYETQNVFSGHGGR